MAARGGAWRWLVVTIAVLATLAALASNAVSSCDNSRDIDLSGALSQLNQSLDNFHVDLFCPTVDVDGVSIWVNAFSGQELVVVASTQDNAAGPSLLAGERNITPTNPGMMSVEVGAPSNGLWSIAFDRPPKEGDIVDLSVREAPAVAGTTPPSTLVDLAPPAGTRYSYTFTGGRFHLTATTAKCGGG